MKRKVEYQGEVLDSSEVLKQLNRKPLTLQAKEGLALINGTQAMTAQGVISWIETENLAYQAEWIAALTHQALHGITDAYHEAVHQVRNFEEQTAVARRMSDWLEGSKLTTRQGKCVFKTLIHCVVFHKSMVQASKCFNTFVKS